MSQEWDPHGEVSEALREVVAGFGEPALSSAAVLRSQLSDVVAGYPRELNVLAMAARAGAAATLTDLIRRQGMSPNAAVSLAADQITAEAADPAGALWAAGALARALGYEVTIPAAAGAASGGGTSAGAASGGGSPRPRAPEDIASLARQDTELASGTAVRSISSSPAPWWRARRGLAAAGTALAVVLAVVLFLELRGPGSNAASCVTGTWDLRSGSNATSLPDNIGTVDLQPSQGGEAVEYEPDGQLLIDYDQLEWSGQDSAGDSVSVVVNGQGSAGYQVAGSQIDYHDADVPGTTVLYENGSEVTSANSTPFGDSSAHFTCAGNSLTLSGTGYSDTYARSTAG
jgi:hypothetical protein